MDKKDNPLWVEKYRPSTVDECILPERLKIPFRKCVDDKDIQSILLHGTAGVGKTTIAVAMCEEIGCDYMIINGSDESGIDVLRNKIAIYASSMSLSGGKKVIIIDEADYLNPNSTQPGLRNAIEKFSSNCTFIFTCNYRLKIIEPLRSRFAEIDFTLHNNEKAQMAKGFFKVIQGILKDNNIEYENPVLAEFIKKHFPDFRKTINELQHYSKFGRIDTGILSYVTNIEITEVLSHIKNKDFGSIRKWVASNDINPNAFFRQIYDGLYEFMKPQSIPQAVIILADYQYKQAFVADSQINIVACLTELMASCEFN
ncbi:AAA family ATPase [Candidatus Dojkabacteria bacterium]|jgi:DNA polymerase III delta prime subunit|nr:AAA family ATPase [Candidatus Dojkabacteria bacterium]